MAVTAARSNHHNHDHHDKHDYDGGANDRLSSQDAVRLPLTLSPFYLSYRESKQRVRRGVLEKLKDLIRESVQKIPTY